MFSFLKRRKEAKEEEGDKEIAKETEKENIQKTYFANNISILQNYYNISNLRDQEHNNFKKGDYVKSKIIPNYSLDCTIGYVLDRKEALPEDANMIKLGTMSDLRIAYVKNSNEVSSVKIKVTDSRYFQKVVINPEIPVTNQGIPKCLWEFAEDKPLIEKGILEQQKLIRPRANYAIYEESHTNSFSSYHAHFHVANSPLMIMSWADKNQVRVAYTVQGKNNEIFEQVLPHYVLCEISPV